MCLMQPMRMAYQKQGNITWWKGGSFNSCGSSHQKCKSCSKIKLFYLLYEINQKLHIQFVFPKRRRRLCPIMHDKGSLPARSLKAKSTLVISALVILANFTLEMATDKNTSL